MINASPNLISLSLSLSRIKRENEALIRFSYARKLSSYSLWSTTSYFNFVSFILNFLFTFVIWLRYSTCFVSNIFIVSFELASLRLQGRSFSLELFFVAKSYNFVRGTGIEYRQNFYWRVSQPSVKYLRILSRLFCSELISLQNGRGRFFKMAKFIRSLIAKTET